MQLKHFVPALFLTVAAFGCGSRHQLTTGEGFVQVNGGKIWYRVVAGEHTGDQIPVLLVHGGPAFAHYYLNPLLALSSERPVIVFDQLGCGKSGRITDTSLMTIGNHVEQIRLLLDHLGIKDCYLYGHSWGAMPAFNYYLQHRSKIRALVLASPYLSSTRWEADAAMLIGSLPDPARSVIMDQMEGKPVDSVKMVDATATYFNTFYTRQPLTSNHDSSIRQSGANVYGYMWGQYEWKVTGTLKNADVVEQLKTVTVPTLFMAGEYDAARPSTVKYYQDITPGAQLFVNKGAGHSTMHDNPPADLYALRKFFKECDTRR